MCVENPGYPGAVLAFQAFGAKICAGVDDEGIVIRQLPSGVRLTTYPGISFLGNHHDVGAAPALLDWARNRVQ